jgi:hypothetical protein
MVKWLIVATERGEVGWKGTTSHRSEKYSAHISGCGDISLGRYTDQSHYRYEFFWTPSLHIRIVQREVLTIGVATFPFSLEVLRGKIEDDVKSPRAILPPDPSQWEWGETGEAKDLPPPPRCGVTPEKMFAFVERLLNNRNVSISDSKIESGAATFARHQLSIATTLSTPGTRTEVTVIASMDGPRVEASNVIIKWGDDPIEVTVDVPISAEILRLLEKKVGRAMDIERVRALVACYETSVALPLGPCHHDAFEEFSAALHARQLLLARPGLLAADSGLRIRLRRADQVLLTSMMSTSPDWRKRLAEDCTLEWAASKERISE